MRREGTRRRPPCSRAAGGVSAAWRCWAGGAKNSAGFVCAPSFSPLLQASTRRVARARGGASAVDGRRRRGRQRRGRAAGGGRRRVALPRAQEPFCCGQTKETNEEEKRGKRKRKKKRETAVHRALAAAVHDAAMPMPACRPQGGGCGRTLSGAAGVHARVCVRKKLEEHSTDWRGRAGGRQATRHHRAAARQQGAWGAPYRAQRGRTRG